MNEVLEYKYRVREGDDKKHTQMSMQHSLCLKEFRVYQEKYP